MRSTGGRRFRIQHVISLGVLHAEDHFAPLGELDGVADEIDHDLPQAGRIANDDLWHVGHHPPGQLQAFFVGPQGQQLHRVAQHFPQLERDRFQIELVGLDLGEIQHVVDQAQQRVGRLVDHHQKFALIGRQRRIQQQFRHADNAVHGRANFVAHVGHEGAFGAVGRFGGGFRTSSAP